MTIFLKVKTFVFTLLQLKIITEISSFLAF